jgi:hypothetical protein
MRTLGNPVDPFAHVLHETHQHAGPHHSLVESDSEPIHSPYTPTTARERACRERHPEGNDPDPLRSPYAPKKARTQPVVLPHDATRKDVAPLPHPRGPERLSEHHARYAIDTSESYLFSHDPDLDPALQFASPRSRQHEPPAAARRDASIRDLERLEAALCWVQREEAAARIPRAAQLPPVAGLASVDARGRPHGGEILDFPAPRWLEQQRMGPPPTMRSRRHKLRAPLILLIMSIFAVPSGYYFSTEGWSPSSQPAPGPQMASFASKTDAPPSFIGQQNLPRVMARDDESRDHEARENDRKMSAQGEVSSQRPEPSQPPRSSEGETAATLQPSATPDQAPLSSEPIRVLDPEEIKLLLKQGEQLIAVGDMVTARTVLRRAAQAGNASAAMTLGATYDPNVLAKLGVVGVSADVEKARDWYQKAETLGSPPPQVLIYRSASGYKMKVESTSQAARAERLAPVR